MANKLNNCYLINAPAGSGKTTEIKSIVQRCIIDNPKDNILCITYTNRAADELSKGILSKNVFIGTIHSFLHFFLKPYFAHQDILELYFEIYGAQISERIDNKSQKESIAESNARYIEKYGKLDYDMVRNNIKVLSYNESPFSSLYYGGLSHDDLIGFSKAIFNRYPVIKKRMTSKYQFIFIDEYQDTMSDVLKIFFESVHNTKTKLFLFGDRMQQIYKNYDGSFEESFELFDTTKALTTNYRSTKSIVNILNRIYNDPAFVQNISEKMRSTDSDFDPRIIISHSIQAEIENLRKTDPDTLILYLFNKERFSDIDAIHLYDAFNSMEKYSFGKAVSAVDVLTTRYEDNPDALLKVLFCVVDLLKLYKAQQYGNIIQILKGNKSIFSKESWNIQTHNDKETVFNSIKQVFNIIESESKTIADLIRGLSNVHLLNEDNMLNAIQQGILTPSTKERLESFEKKKNELSVEIVKEEMAKPAITKDQIVFWLHRFRKLDTKKREHRRRLIDSFVNAVYLYDDRMIITFNYKDGSKTITLAELGKSALGSDINVPAPPSEKP